MLIKKSIKLFRLFHSTIVLSKTFLKGTTSLSNILHVTVVFFQVKIYIKSTAFQFNSELFVTKNILPSTDEMTVDLVHKCLQQLHLFALHLKILGYMPGLLNGLEYLRRTGVFRVDL